MDEVFWGSMIASTLRVSTPLILCALAGLFSERSGVVDIGLEGKLLASAFAAAATAVTTQSLTLAIMAAIAVAISFSLIHGFACVTHSGDQVISGVAINIVAAGLTAVLGAAWFRQGGQTPSVPDHVRMGPLSTDVANALQEYPILEAFLGQSSLVYIGFLAVLASWWLLWKTRFGLRLRAVGENPAMVESAGVSVQRMRYSALVINGILCGLAGAYLVLSLSASFVPNMSAGRGFMALAALIFGKWKPKATLLACLLFGFLDAAAIRLQGVVLPTIGEIPVQFIQALPYLLTVILLAGFIGKAVAPKAIGVPYTKERT